MSTDSSVRYEIKNELKPDKKKIAKIEDFGDFDEFDEETHFDEVDGGEYIPLTGRGIVVTKGDDPNTKPAGFYPQWPTFYPDVADPNIPNLNLYQQKKSMAQGLLDLALLSANANQLRYVLDSNTRNHYFYVSLTLISLSLVLQVLVAIALVFKSRYNIDNQQEYENADRLNNFIMIGILLITISNVISSAFAPAPAL